MADVLLIEDNREVTFAVGSILRDICNIQAANSLAEAKMCLNSKKFDLLLIDLGLPDGSGFNLISTFGRSTPGATTPFLLLSGDTSTESQVAGFSMGAEDYITKPFNPFILKARVLNCLRRLQASTANEVSIGGLTICRSEFRAYQTLPDSQKIPLELTTLEFRLLSVFADHLGEALSRQMLIDLAWGSSTNIIDRNVDQHVFSLRKKIRSTNVKILSIYGHGYRMESSKAAMNTQQNSYSETTLPSLSYSVTHSQQHG